MAMPAAQRVWTVEMLDALPDDGNRYELIDGELFVTPAASDVHQLVVGALHARLRAYMRPSEIGRAMMSPADVRREDRRHNRVQPDLFVVRMRDGRFPEYPYDMADLLLAVEVVSPSNPSYDYQTKRALYLRSIPEYWVVDAQARTFARWQGAADPGVLLAEKLEWRPQGMSDALVVELSEFFEDALG
jgi:Uma2 family endonuclease